MLSFMRCSKSVCCEENFKQANVLIFCLGPTETWMEMVKYVFFYLKIDKHVYMAYRHTQSISCELLVGCESKDVNDAKLMCECVFDV